MRHPLHAALLTAALLSTSQGAASAVPAGHLGPAAPAAEPSSRPGDPLVAKAVERIASVEAAEATLVAGDKPGADRLLNRLAWAKKRLGAVVQQGTAEWKGASQRHDAVLAKITAKRDAKAPQPAPQPGPKPGPKPGGTPVPAAGKTGSKGTPKPASSGTKKPSGTPVPAPKPAYDHAKVVRLNEDVSRAFNNLKILSFKHFNDDNRVRGLTKEIESFQARLAAFPKDHANVKVVAENVENFRALYQMGVDRVTADRAAAPGITAKLDELVKTYDRPRIPANLEAPYTEGQLRAWAAQVRALRTEQIPKDLEWLRAAGQNVVVDPGRINGMLSHVGTTWVRELEGREAQLRMLLDSQAADGVRRAEFLLETDPTDKNQVLQRVLGKGAFDENMRFLRAGEESVRMAGVCDQAFDRKDAPDRVAQGRKLEQAIRRLKELARVALDDVRMPKAASTDKTLLKTAAETLQRKEYGVGKWKRLVINAPLRKLERREAYIDSSSSSSASVTFYDYVWEQFQVTTAEEVDGEIWLFSNTLKRYESGDSTTPVGKWILSQRFELTPILAENLEL